MTPLSSSDFKVGALHVSCIHMELKPVCIRGHNFPVWDVAAGPAGHYFASASADRTARVWATERARPLRLLAGACVRLVLCKGLGFANVGGVVRAPVYRMRYTTSSVLLRMCEARRQVWVLTWGEHGRLAQKVVVACTPAQSRGRRQGSPAGGQLRSWGVRRAPQRRDRGEVAPQQPPAGHRLGRPHRARVGRARRPRRARARRAHRRGA